MILRALSEFISNNTHAFRLNTHTSQTILYTFPDIKEY